MGTRQTVAHKLITTSADVHLFGLMEGLLNDLISDASHGPCSYDLESW